MGACDEDEETSGFGWQIAVGITISVLASTASNLGVNVQKYSFKLEEKKPADARRPYVKQWRWWCGLVLVIIGAIGDFVAFAFAPASIVTPVGSFTLVSNLFFASLWLGEKLGMRDFVGTALIVTGATVAVAFGDHTTKCYEIQELRDLWEQTAVYIYLGAVFVVLVAMYLTVRAAERILTQAAASDTGSTTPVLVTDVEPPAAYGAFARWHPLCIAGLAGILGAQTVLFAKSTAEILKVSFAGDNQMTEVLTYVILACMFATIFSQQHWLAHGLQFFDALYIVPVFQAFFIGVSVLAGGVYFREFAGFDTLQWVLFPTGVLLCLVGVFLLSDRDMSGKDTKPLLAPDTPTTAATTASGAPSPTPPSRRRRTSILAPLLLPDAIAKKLGGGVQEPAAPVTSASAGGMPPRFRARTNSFLRPNWTAAVLEHPTDSLLPVPHLARGRAATHSGDMDLPPLHADLSTSPGPGGHGVAGTPHSEPLPATPEADGSAVPPAPRRRRGSMLGGGARPARRRSVLQVLGTGFVEMLGAGMGRPMLAPTMAAVDEEEAAAADAEADAELGLAGAGAGAGSGGAAAGVGALGSLATQAIAEVDDEDAGGDEDAGEVKEEGDDGEAHFASSPAHSAVATDDVPAAATADDGEATADAAAPDGEPAATVGSAAADGEEEAVTTDVIAVDVGDDAGDTHAPDSEDGSVQVV